MTNRRVSVEVTGSAVGAVKAFQEVGVAADEAARVATEAGDKVAAAAVRQADTAAQGAARAAQRAAAESKAAAEAFAEGDTAAYDRAAAAAEKAAARAQAAWERSAAASASAAAEASAAEGTDAEAAAAKAAEAAKASAAAAREQWAAATTASHDAAALAERDAGRFGTAMEGAATKTGGVFQKLGATLGNWGLPFGESISKMGEKFSEAQTGGQKFGTALAGLGKVAATAGLAGFAVVGAESVKMASNFQESMTQLVTGAGESKKAIGMVSNGILSMAAQVGQTPEALAKGLYLVESAGYHGAAGLSVLKAAAEGAKVGNADMSTVADAVTSALNAYGLKASDASAVTSQLVATTAAGKMHMQDLAGALSAVLPVAAAAHLNFSQVGGAIATMTGQGMSAQQATQDLAHTIQALQNPNSVAIGEMEQLGLKANDVETSLGKRGLTGTLGMLTQAITSHMGPAGTVILDAFNQSQSAAGDLQVMLKSMPAPVRALAEQFMSGSINMTQFRKSMPTNDMGMLQQFTAMYGKVHGFNNVLKSGSPAAQTFTAALAKMMGGTTGLNTALLLSGSHAGAFAQNVASVADAAKNGKTNVQGWADVQKDFSFQMEQAKAGAEALGVRLGDVLIPKIEDVIRVVSDVVVWFEKHATVAKVLGGVIGGVLVVAVGAYVVSMAAAAVATIAAAAPILAIIAACALVAVGIYELATHWKQVWGFIKQIADDAYQFLDGVWQHVDVSVRHWFGDVENFFLDLWDAIDSALRAAWGAIETFFAGLWQDIDTALRTAWGAIETFFYDLWQSIFSAVQTAWNDIETFFAGLWQTITSAVQTAWNAIAGFFVATWQAIQATIEGTWNTIASDLSGAWQAFTGVTSAAWQAITGAVSAVWNGLFGPTGVVASVWSGIKSFLNDEWSGWVTVVSGAWGAITGAVTAVWNGVFGSSGIVATVWSGIKSFLGDEWSGWVKVVSSLWGGIVGAITTAWDGLKSGASSVWQEVKSLFNDGVNGVIDVINFFIKALDVIPGVNIKAIAHVGGATGAGNAKGQTPSAATAQSVTSGIPGHESGGMMSVGAGFTTNGPQAVVGEGNCVAEGTLIATNRGERPIEDVREGDWVATRNGYRQVLWAGLTRPNADVVTVHTGLESVTCTPDHRVWVLPTDEHRSGDCLGRRVVRGRRHFSRLRGQVRYPRADDGRAHDGPRCAGEISQHRRGDFDWSADEAGSQAHLDSERLRACPSEGNYSGVLALAWGSTNCPSTGSASRDRRTGRGSEVSAGVLPIRAPQVAGGHLREPQGLRDLSYLQAGPGPRVDAAEARWVEASKIRSGDWVWRLTPSGALAPVLVVAVTPATRVDTFDLTVDQDHEFIAGGILVHNSQHPEFVIPTDPKYRANAHSLLGALLGRIGMPMMESGGILGDIGGAIGGAAGAVGGAIGSAVGDLSKLTGAALQAAIGAVISGGESVADSALGHFPFPVKQMGEWGVNSIGNAVRGLAAALGSSGGGGSAGGGIPVGGAPSGSHLSLIRQALGLAGVPDSPANESAVNQIVTHESGWNPNAINNWDSNAKAGDPSRGLMQCVTLDVRILTRRGWLTHDGVRVGDETLGYNAATGRSEWTPITKIVHYDNAPVWRIGNRQWHADVTPNHRWWSDTAHVVRTETATICPECGYKSTPRGVSTHRGRIHGVRAERQVFYRGEFVRTENLRAGHRIRLAAPADTDGFAGLSLEEAAVLAWLQGDGHLARAAGGGWDGAIYQSKPVMISKLRALLARVEHSESSRHRNERSMPAHTFRLRRAWVSDLMKRVEELPVTDPEAFVLRLSAEQRAAWLSAMIDAEGNRMPGKKPGHAEFVRIAQVNGPLQEAIKLAVYLEGYRPTFSTNSAERRGYRAAGSVGMARPHIAPSMFQPHQELEPQTVWCVKTPLETWTAGQDGQVFLTGNTIMTTFERWRLPTLADNIYDPLSNLVAGIRYAVAGYGSLSNVPGVAALAHGGGYVGYDTGGVLRPGSTLAVNMTGADEYVFTPDQARSLAGIGVGVGGPSATGAGGGGVTVLDNRQLVVQSDVSQQTVAKLNVLLAEHDRQLVHMLQGL